MIAASSTPAATASSPRAEGSAACNAASVPRAAAVSSAPAIVTLDGPAGVGKSTLAKRAAKALGFAYLDTGAMFRTIALGLGSQSPWPEGPALALRLRDFSFSLQGSGEDTELLCNGAAMGTAIRTEEAGLLASRAAKLPEVREFLKEAQQRLGAAFSLVAEGRDMGTVVFPAARCKIFLDASPEVRAMRRFLQLREMNQPCDLAELTEQIRLRDEADRTRALAPLRPADDARVIDTSDKDIDAVFAAIMGAVKERL